MGKSRRPPVVTRRDLVAEDPFVRLARRKEFWYSTAAGKHYLRNLPPRRAKQLMDWIDNETVQRQLAAQRVGVSIKSVPARPVWRSRRHERVYTVDAVSALIFQSKKTIYNHLSLHRRHFRRRYRRGKDHPRRLRVLTPRDIRFLDALRTVFIKHEGKFVRIRLTAEQVAELVKGKEVRSPIPAR